MRSCYSLDLEYSTNIMGLNPIVQLGDTGKFRRWDLREEIEVSRGLPLKEILVTQPLPVPLLPSYCEVNRSPLPCAPHPNVLCCHRPKATQDQVNVD